jgi:hypothetical protein
MENKPLEEHFNLEELKNIQNLGLKINKIN